MKMPHCPCSPPLASTKHISRLPISRRRPRHDALSRSVLNVSSLGDKLPLLDWDITWPSASDTFHRWVAWYNGLSDGQSGLDVRSTGMVVIMFVNCWEASNASARRLLSSWSGSFVVCERTTPMEAKSASRPSREISWEDMATNEILYLAKAVRVIMHYLHQEIIIGHLVSDHSQD